MLEMGIVVALGLLVMFAKLSPRNRLRMLSYPLVMDLLVFITLCFLHWGTFSGVMVATVGALFCSIVLAGLRAVYGHLENGKHVPGRFGRKS